jgi:hypothetical protein
MDGGLPNVFNLYIITRNYICPNVSHRRVESTKRVKAKRSELDAKANQANA